MFSPLLFIDALRRNYKQKKNVALLTYDSENTDTADLTEPSLQEAQKNQVSICGASSRKNILALAKSIERKTKNLEKITNKWSTALMVNK